eukprot:1918881-Rhodomonas_salina.3
MQHSGDRRWLAVLTGGWTPGHAARVLNGAVGFRPAHRAQQTPVPSANRARSRRDLALTSGCKRARSLASGDSFPLSSIASTPHTYPIIECARRHDQGQHNNTHDHPYTPQVSGLTRYQQGLQWSYLARFRRHLSGRLCPELHVPALLERNPASEKAADAVHKARDEEMRRCGQEGKWEVARDGWMGGWTDRRGRKKGWADELKSGMCELGRLDGWTHRVDWSDARMREVKDRCKVARMQGCKEDASACGRREGPRQKGASDSV